MAESNYVDTVEWGRALRKLSVIRDDVGVMAEESDAMTAATLRGVEARLAQLSMLLERVIKAQASE